MRFAKYEALGNDYLVLEPNDGAGALAPEAIARLCDRHRGIGADGILVRDDRSDGGLALRIANPDGSPAEKSGNGLRIFARYLWDRGEVGDAPFRVETAGGDVECRVGDDGRSVHVEMGRVSFDSRDVPVTGEPREVLRERLEVAGRTLEFSAASIGNPHCVVLRTRIDEAELRALGPAIERHPLFPERTNVQFVEVRDARHLVLAIWERGAGYTLASGSSSCAAAAVARRLGLCAADVRVEMPGGSLAISVRADFSVAMEGPVAAVAEGRVADDLLAAIR